VYSPTPVLVADRCRRCRHRRSAHASSPSSAPNAPRIPAASIAILVRARSHLAALVTELQRSAPELRYQAVEIERLEERQVIQDLLALTRALHHRADRVNWLAILRAPWCGLTLPDLHALAADDHDSTVWQLMQDEARIARLSADGQARLTHVRGVLAEALAWQGRLRPRRWVEMAWRGLGGAACLRSALPSASMPRPGFASSTSSKPGPASPSTGSTARSPRSTPSPIRKPAARPARPFRS
jgi:hypothetical protein